MASEEELKKINVRSPYFINVTKAVSLGGEEPPEPIETGDDSDGSGDTGGGEEPFVEPTEPTVTTYTLDCGGTKVIGVVVGIQRYEIPISGKQIGDYDVDFSKITVPFYAKIGLEGNMPASYTFMAGWVNSNDTWLDAVGTSTPSYTTIASHPNGNSQTLTYTSTQSDIDTYGEKLVLELFFPIFNLDSSTRFTLNCAADEVIATEDSGQSSVFVMTIGSGHTGPEVLSGVVNQLNGVDASWLTFPDKYKFKTFVFGDYTPNLEPVIKEYAKHLNSAELVDWDDSRHTVVYRPASDINLTQNVIKLKQRSLSNSGNSVYKIWFSKHTIETVTDATRTNDEAFTTYRNIPSGGGNINLVSRLFQEGLNHTLGQGQWVYWSGFESEQIFTINTTGTAESDLTLETNHLTNSTMRIKSVDNAGREQNNRVFNLVPAIDDQYITLYSED